MRPVICRSGLGAGVIAALVLGLAGCATRGDVDKINARLDALDQRVAGVETAARNAESRATAAEQAAADARRAAQAAEDSARKSEAIFQKRISK
jgi:outer membrane murein-binding lipoprotein Lpp